MVTMVKSATQVFPSEYTTGALALIQRAQQLTEGLARAFSIKYNIPVEDLRQEAALAILETIRRRGTLPPADGFLYTSVRFHFFNVLKKHRRQTSHIALSLDAPCSEYEGASTYGELLIDDGPSLDETLLHRTVQRAVSTLPADEQGYISEHFTGHLDTAPASGERNRKTVGSAAYRHLRAALRSELQDSLEPICDTPHCQNEATAFDGERVMFVCSEHSQKEALQ